MPAKNESKIEVVVIGRSEDARAKAKSLARDLNLHLTDSLGDRAPLLLAVTDSRVELRLNEPDAPGPVYVDFIKGPLGYTRRLNPFGKLIQAVCPSGAAPRVLDATAGLAHDAFILALKGCHVHAVERSPIVAALVRDGIERASVDPELKQLFDERFRLVCADAYQMLDAMEANAAPDVIYLDPMFPPKKKSALVKKEMRVLRRLVGDDPDSEALLEAARQKARQHVVVKRMLHAPSISEDIERSYKGKTTRYDLYAPFKSS